MPRSKGDVFHYISFTSEGREWMQDPNPCKTENPDLFFPTGFGASYIKAMDICNKCPNQLQCLEYALDHNMEHGIWGGRSERDRRRIQRTRKLPA